MPAQTVKLLYIGGWGRSGSTILARILGQLEGFFHSGELRTLWIDGLKPQSQCGCGRLIRDCSLWRQILTHCFGSTDKIDRQTLTQLLRQCEPRTYEILTASLWPPQARALQSRLQPYQAVLSQLYGAIQEVTSCKVIVDDSLHPGYAYTLASLPEIELYLVHLIRDPRATGYSWQKRLKKGIGSYSFRDNALGWCMRNLGVEWLASQQQGRSLRLFYEEFALHPQSSLQKILAFIGEEGAQLPLSAKM
ncbi:MAG: sulfotransferase [Chloroflexaceae bacterium]|nr:sulfotransferase [Chloroflexaceae bacterium]